MSIKIRLFLVISGLFLCFTLISSIMETRIMNQSIDKAEKNVRNKILQSNDQTRNNLENFVAWLLAQSDTNINAVLNNTASLKLGNLRFGPTDLNVKKGTWENTSELLLNFNWIDFIQNTNSHQATTIIPNTESMKATYRVAINDQLAWVYLYGKSQPYLAVQIPHKETNLLKIEQAPNEIISGVDLMPYLLFDISNFTSDKIQPLAQIPYPAIPLAWEEGYSLQIDQVPIIINQTINQFQAGNLKLPSIDPNQIQKGIEMGLTAQGGNLFRIPAKALMKTSSLGKFMDKELEDIIVRYSEVNLIWVLMSLFDTGMFGSDLFTPPSPEGVSLFFVHDDVGVGLLSKDVLYPQVIFDDKSYYDKNPGNPEKSSPANSLAIINAPNSAKIYFGNTARFIIKPAASSESIKTDEIKQAFLTIGIDCDKVLKNVMLAVRETSMLVHAGKIVSAYSNNGRITISDEVLPIDLMLKNNSGIINWEEKNYFYMHLHPFSEIDLHFFILTPEEKEFALLRELTTESRQIVSSVLDNLHLNGLILLAFAIILSLHMSSRITKPIIALAGATKKVREGKLDEIHIPKTDHRDEINTLCASFEDMVNGLKEKEKVKGVLNKVVSEEVAKEILKGTLHLGGEEAVVTLLFADIRGFTRLTQKMPPHEVVDLLNACMTKVTSIIDAHHGVVDKFVGDEVIAIFGAPLRMKDAPWQAIVCATEIIEALKKWNVERSLQNLPIVEMGIGIHTGVALVGNMGAENRLNYTVVGNTVNLTARICAVAKGMEILISEATLKEPNIEEKIQYEKLEPITLKGFAEPIVLNRIVSLKSKPLL